MTQHDSCWPRVYKPGVCENSPEITCFTTLIKNTNTMEGPPLHINVTHNPQENRAILHIDCQSDGKVERWMKDREEAREEAKNVWLGKLGCLLKIHGRIKCQWPHSSVETNTNMPLPPDTFNDPWAYRVSDFPENYKLFAAERQAQGENPPRKDYYLCGMSFPSTYGTSLTTLSGGHSDYRSPLEFYPHLHWLLNNAQGVEKPCICQYCDPSRSQKEINKIFYLPPCREATKHPRSANKHQKARKLKGPKGVTSKRGLIFNRNSIMTGPLTTLGHSSENHKIIGYKSSHPF